MERIEKLAAFASNWWANKLRETDKDVFNYANLGEKTEIVNYYGSISIQNNKNKLGYAEKVDTFEYILYLKIVDELMRSRSSAFLYVDYEPEGILYSAMKDADLRVNNACGLPWKTSMDISIERGVSVSKGDSPYQILME